SSAADAASFDSVPGTGFDTNSVAAAVVPPPGKLTGTGSAMAISPAQNNAFRAINRAWSQGGTVQFGSGGRYVISGLTESAQADLVRALALMGERTEPTGVIVRKPRIGLFQPWSGSMDEGWTRWVLEAYGFEFVSLHPADFHAPLAGKVDVVVLADDA